MFTPQQQVVTNLPHFPNGPARVIDINDDGTITVQMQQATQWHDDESGGEIFRFQPQYLIPA